MAATYGIAPAGYRLPDATQIGRVILQVADLERSLAYYGTVVGFSVLAREADRAELGPAGGPVLVELRERKGARPVPRRGLLGLYHFAILLPDRRSLGAFLRHLAEAGEQAGMSDHLVSEAIYLTDPDGLGIEVYADRPRASWRDVDGQLVMATNPLDTRSLLAAAGDAPWSGLPAGTVIGHVHLFVGNIDQAARFYHDGLGFDKTVWNYPGALFLSAGGYHHHLGTNTWAAGAAPAGDDDARLVEWDLVVPSEGDAARALDSVAAGGGAVTREGAGGIARDPWGTAVRVRAAGA
ncbi:MAG TPA: VOC family protein [Gemmatimonadales bacterium]